MTTGELVIPTVELPTIELPTEDGIPLESSWHRAEINLLIESLRYRWQDRDDFYVGGNMFIYYSFEQVRHRHYRGPDFFVVLGVDGTRYRGAWVVWEEHGRYPNVIVELLSPTTAQEDRTTKKDLYEQVFRTPEYFCYEPNEQVLEGWRLQGSQYLPLTPDERGFLWSEQLHLWLGLWQGEYQGIKATWLRFFDEEGHLVLTPAEAERQRAEAERQRAEAERQRAEAERQRAEAERQRAEQAEAELARLRARLREMGIGPNDD